MDILFLSLLSFLYGKVMPVPEEQHVVSALILPTVTHCVRFLCSFIIIEMANVNMTLKMCCVISCSLDSAIHVGVIIHSLVIFTTLFLLFSLSVCLQFGFLVHVIFPIITAVFLLDFHPSLCCPVNICWVYFIQVVNILPPSVTPISD